MDFALSPENSNFIQRFRDYLDTLGPDLPGHGTGEGPNAPDHPVTEEERAARTRFVQRLGADGWLGAAAPAEVGGMGRSNVEHWLMMEELAYRRLPTMVIGVTIVANTLLRIGSEEQRREYLPKIYSGEYQFCLGYTEPEAGTDLASLRTRAVRDGDEYVIDGQKIYTTGAEYASHIWLAVRTGPPGSLHRGLSVLIVPVDTPGITVRPLITLADYRTNEVFYDGVRVPAANLVGEENGGWGILAMALDFERTPQANAHVQALEELLGWATTTRDADGSLIADDPTVRADLAVLATRNEVSRLFSLRMADMYARGEIPNVEASIVKIWNSELYQDSASVALSIMGQDGQLGVGVDGAPRGGHEELRYRESAVQRISAGTNEVQRDIIAQRGLGLPRNRR
ncbi:acyl-CoA dehydrogenase family protein [Streptosporangium sp. NPDC051022]|uniref:acyl-CoA dehydrogenase family protein n=1 Tax=Streptosporangium sp. NPDC051022 TaxID=3155752 RepID=UPI0034396FE6